MTCCKTISKGSLYVVNTLFILIGLATFIGSVAITVEDKWSRFFDTDTLKLLLAASFGILLVATLGCCGACKEKKRYLLPYILFVFAALVIQAAGCYFVIDYNSAMACAEKAGFEQSDYISAQTRVMDFMKDGTEKVFNEGNCAVTVDNQGEVVSLACDDSAKWFQTFVNTQCPVGTSLVTDKNVMQCITDSGSGDVQANGVYCVCRHALVAKVNEYSKPLEIAAVSLAALEVLLLIFACRLVCAKRKQTEEERKQALGVPLQQGQQYNPPYVGSGNGAPVITQGANMV